MLNSTFESILKTDISHLAPDWLCLSDKVETVQILIVLVVVSTNTNNMCFGQIKETYEINSLLSKGGFKVSAEPSVLFGLAKARLKISERPSLISPYNHHHSPTGPFKALPGKLNYYY